MKIFLLSRAWKYALDKVMPTITIRPVCIVLEESLLVHLLSMLIEYQNHVLSSAPKVHLPLILQNIVRQHVQALNMLMKLLENA